MKSTQIAIGFIGRPSSAEKSECIFCGDKYKTRMPFDFILLWDDRELNGACTRCQKERYPELYAAITLLNKSKKQLEKLKLTEKESSNEPN